MNDSQYPAIDAVETFICALVEQNKEWTHQYALDIVKQDVFSAFGHMARVYDLISEHGAHAVEEAIRRLEQ